MDGFAMTKRRYGLNAEPRLSANQLAEYLGASATRRKSIIRDAKFPRTVVVDQYREAGGGISRYLTNLTTAPDVLAETMIRLQQRETAPEATDWVRQDCVQSREAIDTFLRSFNALGLGRFEFRAVTGNPPPLQIAGVSVAVNLDATVHGTRRGLEGRFGGLILSSSKSAAPKGEATTPTKAAAEKAANAAVLAHALCQRFPASSGQADPRLSLAMDVFAQALTPAPTAHRSRLKNIELACEEITHRWDRVEPSDDYDGP